jgi:hypothetical protein
MSMCFTPYATPSALTSSACSGISQAQFQLGWAMPCGGSSNALYGRRSSGSMAEQLLKASDRERRAVFTAASRHLGVPAAIVDTTIPI